jgi:hypothetical protein
LTALRRTLAIVTIALGAVAVGAYWAVPVWLCLSTAAKTPESDRLVPTDLQDLSISQAPGSKLSYLGYEFEVPWTDIDPTETKASSDEVVLRFRSGLVLMVGSTPAGFWKNGLASGFKASPKAVKAAFGSAATDSDYRLLRTLYNFTPTKLTCWSSRASCYRGVFLLTMKSAALLPSARSGFFNIRNQTYMGFQQGGPQSRATVNVALYSETGSIEFTFFQKDYGNRAGVSQAEINRVVQSLRKSSDDRPQATANNQSDVGKPIRFDKP